MRALRLRVVAFAVILAGSPAVAQSSVKTVELTFTRIDVPGAGFSYVSGINASGDMVGTYGLIDNGRDGHGFLLVHGSFNYFDFPGADLIYTGGINDSDVVVGTVEFAGGLIEDGFLYDGRTYAKFDVPGQPQTAGRAINNAGTVVGAAGNFSAQVRAFEMQNGRFQQIFLPDNASFQEALGINNLNEIAAITANGICCDGFEYRNGKTKALNFPGTFAATAATGINDHGIVVGYYFVSRQGYHGFAYKDGKYVSFAVPGAIETYPAGISASGQIVGEYVWSDYSEHGFLTSPISLADFE